MTNLEISKLLRNVAAAYSIVDEKKFRFQIIAYQKAADTIYHATVELRDLYKEDKLDTLQGVGTSIKSYLEELITKGKVKHFEYILRDIPAAVFPLLEVPSFGPKKAFRLVSEFKLSNPESVISDLANLAKEKKIAKLDGFGEKSQADILRAIEEYRRGKTKTSRMVLPYADELANRMVAYLLKSKAVLMACTLGSLRRREATIGDIDIAVASNQPEVVLDHFTEYPGMERLIERGSRTSSMLVASDKQIDVMVQPPEGFGALLQHFTGSKAHNIHLREHAISMGLSLSEYGIKKEMILKKYDTEEKLYKALGMDWISPEMREDKGEIELAKQHKLPKLLELADIKGDFHLHSSYPIEPSHDMGQNSMKEMIQKAIELKYTYLGFSEHNPSLSKHNTSQIQDIIKQRSNVIEQLKYEYKKVVHIFSLLEIDILPNGNLSLDSKSLELLDGAIVSIHSVFNMDRKSMTKRVLQGLSHPKAKILAHPTGRLLNARAGYDLDWDKVFAFCKENNKALEINSSPTRLDLPDNIVRDALRQGVTLVINTDSHAVSQMSLMKYGISIARRGWATAGDILNTKLYNEVDEWFRK